MKRLILIVLLIWGGPLVFGQSFRITEMSMMPMPISNNAVTHGSVNGIPHVFSFGGIDSTRQFSGINLKSYRYNSMSDTWDTIAPLPDTRGKIAAAASTVKNRIYIIGGYQVFSNGNEVSTNKVHRYDPQTNTYLTDGANIPIAIDDHVQAVWRDSLIYVITGWRNVTNRNAVQIYDVVLDTWYVGTPVPNNNIYKSFGASGIINGDTIFYFGGASAASGFPIQNNFRMGIIDPADPTIINWSDTILQGSPVGYRMAALSVDKNLHWIGGSNETYNYDGIAYSNGQGVPPNYRNLYVNANDLSVGMDTSDYPMDLRGIAQTSPTTFYLAGGMENNQKVSKKTLKLEYVNTGVGISEKARSGGFDIYPQPANTYIEIDIAGEGKTTLKIFSMNGGLVKSLEIERRSKVDLSQIPNGTYILFVEDLGYRKLIIHQKE